MSSEVQLIILLILIFSYLYLAIKYRKNNRNIVPYAQQQRSSDRQNIFLNYLGKIFTPIYGSEYSRGWSGIFFLCTYSAYTFSDANIFLPHPLEYELRVITVDDYWQKVGRFENPRDYNYDSFVSFDRQFGYNYNVLEDVSGGFLLGTTLGLFLILFLYSLIIVFIPLYKQKESGKWNFFKKDLRKIIFRNLTFIILITAIIDVGKVIFYHSHRRQEALIIYFFISILGLLLYLLTGFVKPLYTIFKNYIENQRVQQLNSPINLSVAQEKLFELKKALDCDLIDEETFEEMKAKIKVRIKKDI